MARHESIEGTHRRPVPKLLLTPPVQPMLARSTTRYLSCAVALRAATVASFAPAPPASSRVLRRAAMSAMATVPVGRPSWQQTMLRVKDPVKSLAFYRDTLGMTLVDVLKFPQFDFDLYFLTTLPEGEAYPHEPGTAAAHNYLWSMKGATLELTHNYGTEADADFAYHPGNGEKDGFGHVAFNVDDVYAVSAKLEAGGVAFKKRPDEGRMKGLAFALDPDKYAVELVPRAAGAPAIANEYSYSQTMFRIKDPSKTIPFYEALGMTLVKARKYGDFTNYFMCTLQEGEAAPADPWADEARTFSSSRFHPCLELTHNHGTEADAAFEHFNGNKEPRKGFGHIGFLVDDVVATCDSLRALSAYPPAKEPMGGNMKGLAFMCDPDGYWIEIIKRGGYDADATPYYFEDAKPADE